MPAGTHPGQARSAIITWLMGCQIQLFSSNRGKLPDAGAFSVDLMASEIHKTLPGAVQEECQRLS
jgi:hypothetical protein